MAEEEPKGAAKRYQRIRQQNAAEIAEDYAEAIDDLIRGEGEARVMHLARHFGVSHVTVVRTLKRLQEQEILTARPRRAIELTPKGRAIAETSRKRHELVLRFLLSIGVSRERAEADAEGIEHHVSRETLDSMRKHLDT